MNKRMALLQLRITHRNANIVHIYASTNYKSDQEIEEFYNRVHEIMRLKKKGEITIIIVDFNAKIGCGAKGNKQHRVVRSGCKKQQGR